MLDTSVALHLRDGDASVRARVAALDDAVLLSIVTCIELEGGLARDPGRAAIRRAAMDVMYAAMPAPQFEKADVDAYAAIIRWAGYSRRKVIDRMIAAQALVRRATLITMNPGDFSDVPGLNLVAW